LLLLLLSAVLRPGFAAGGLVDLEIMKLMTEDDIGKAPSTMIAMLRCAALLMCKPSILFRQLQATRMLWLHSRWLTRPIDLLGF
jgi:hypothetical protein